MKQAPRKIASKLSPKEQSSTAKPRVDAHRKRGNERAVSSTLDYLAAL